MVTFDSFNNYKHTQNKLFIKEGDGEEWKRMFGLMDGVERLSAASQCFVID